MIRAILIYIFSCYFISSYAQNTNVLYSFFSAGHTYGSPLNPHFGLHDPFVDYIPALNGMESLELGFFTGDVVLTSQAMYWDSAELDLALLNIPFFIAPGNHDIGAEFINRYDHYYQAFIHHDDLFILLTPGGNWSIEEDQLEFLEEQLEMYHESVNHIFIFLHELIWWSPDNEYQDIAINYVPHYPGSTNYKSVVEPLLLAYSNPIVLFAGDLGATPSVSPFMYDINENITLIGSGMGGGNQDNIVVTYVNENGTVYFDLIALNCDDENALGELYDYNLSGYSLDEELPFQIYPNPVSQDEFSIFNSENDNYDMEMFDARGKLSKTALIPAKSVTRVNSEGLKKGLYFIKMSNNKTIIQLKIIII